MYGEVEDGGALAVKQMMAGPGRICLCTTVAEGCRKVPQSND